MRDGGHAAGGVPPLPHPSRDPPRGRASVFKARGSEVFNRLAGSDGFGDYDAVGWVVDYGPATVVVAVAEEPSENVATSVRVRPGRNSML